MKQLVKKAMTAIAFVPALALVASVVLPTQSTYAACTPGDTTIGNGVECARGDNTPADITGQNGLFKRITDVLLFIIGAIAVIMLIIGGIRYTISGGDSNAVTSAKNTILYAIVGIVVALLAYAIVNWVIGSFDDSTTTQVSNKILV